MAKSSNFFKAVLGIGAATAAVLLSRKESRDRLKQEYDKYKENSESYKENAKELANQVASKATETFNEVKQDPKGYAEKVKQDPKGFLQEQKARFSNSEDAASPTLDDVKQSDEAQNNIRIVTEEDLKQNDNKGSNDTK
ncbi:YtxH domain-containing protein [Staphylococcus simulans]|uniref:YtxH domain-containing protein n=1 Tax=Staphylococcus simulans TaxID=1286 RepID=UPI0027E60EB5|nr:YtxH domain-containing protein [Staphylococcus simulans]MDQ7112257.1 YtxH domain-containing protein [Staphylococcus simulans]MDQ7118106.1 YtxH domain-containing protein [Staphylococcus simulans]WMM10323.1 YtxH domain-containing protein [Staphylococcus simulans]